MASIGFLIFPDFQLLDAAGPIAAFEVAGRLGAPYGLKVMALWPGLVRSSSGAAMQAQTLCAVDTLIVAGGTRVVSSRLPTTLRRRSTFRRRPCASGLNLITTVWASRCCWTSSIRTR